MTNTERKQKLEEAEKLTSALIEIMCELRDNKPEEYGWSDLDYPLRYMQDEINSFCFKVCPREEYGALDYIHYAQHKLSEFEAKRNLFNSMKIPED